MGFPRGSVCSAAQTGKPDITERRSGVGRSLRRPRSLARSLRSLCGRAARTGGGGGGGAAGACLCSVRRGRSGLGPEAPRQSRAGTAFAWKQGAPCRVHTPERKLRMKLLWQAKMVTRTLCLLRGGSGGESSPAFSGRVLDSLGVHGAIRSLTWEVRLSPSASYAFLSACLLPLNQTFSAVAFGVSGADVC